MKEHVEGFHFPRHCTTCLRIKEAHQKTATSPEMWIPCKGGSFVFRPEFVIGKFDWSTLPPTPCIDIRDGITVQELAEKLQIPVNRIIKKDERGRHITASYALTCKSAEVIARSFGASIKVCK
jgi:hypothetical protein